MKILIENVLNYFVCKISTILITPQCMCYTPNDEDHVSATDSLENIAPLTMEFGTWKFTESGVKIQDW